MELRQLRHFVVLAEEMHFGRAAKRAFMTQPALSTSVMRLEEEMGVRLFERDSKSMKITLAGAAMLERAREIVSLEEKMLQFARAMGAGRAGFLDVGFTSTLLFRGLTDILNAFTLGFPEVELSMRELSTQMQLDMLRSGRLDVAFINSPVAPAGLESLVLFEERFVACLPRNHFLADRLEIDVADLRHDVFVMFSRDPSPAYYDHIIAICDRGGFQPEVRIAAALVLSVVALVASGIGVSIVPESIGKAGIDGVVYVPLRSEIRGPSAFVAWNAHRDIPGLEALLDTVRRIRKINAGPM